MLSLILKHIAKLVYFYILRGLITQELDGLQNGFGEQL
jgi:hypothetical protein